MKTAKFAETGDGMFRLMEMDPNPPNNPLTRTGTYHWTIVNNLAMGGYEVQIGGVTVIKSDTLANRTTVPILKLSADQQQAKTNFQEE